MKGSNDERISIGIQNYHGSTEYDEENETRHAKALHAGDLITYEAETAKELKEGVSGFGGRVHTIGYPSVIDRSSPGCAGIVTNSLSF